MDTPPPRGFAGFAGNGGGAWGQAQFARQVIAQRARLPVRLGVGTALLVGVLPIVLVLLLAVLCGAAVSIVAAVVGKAMSAVGLSGEVSGSGPATREAPLHDGRENVRVMNRPSA